jgi:hypothetical protein
MAQLRAVATNRPGSSLILNHHDRKATSADFVDQASGTKAIAGGADTVLLLTRPRNDRKGLLQVTGRDIIEGSYALIFDDGAWTLDGATLDLAAKAAHSRGPGAPRSDTSLELLEAVNAAGRPVTPIDVAEAAGIDNDTAGKYLRRFAASGHIRRVGRGLYVALSVSDSESDHPPHQEELGVSDSDMHTPGGGFMARIEERRRRR